MEADLKVNDALNSMLFGLQRAVTICGLSAALLIPIALDAQEDSRQCPDWNRDCMSAKAIVQSAVRIGANECDPGPPVVLLREMRLAPKPALSQRMQAPVVMSTDDLPVVFAIMRLKDSVLVKDSSTVFDANGRSDSRCVFSYSPPDWMEGNKVWMKAFLHEGSYGGGREFMIEVTFQDGYVQDIQYRLGRITQSTAALQSEMIRGPA